MLFKNIKFNFFNLANDQGALMQPPNIGVPPLGGVPGQMMPPMMGPPPGMMPPNTMMPPPNFPPFGGPPPFGMPPPGFPQAAPWGMMPPGFVPPPMMMSGMELNSKVYYFKIILKYVSINELFF